MSQRNQELEDTFLALHQELSKDLVDVALHLCARFGLSATELGTKWEAHILNHSELKNERPTRESLNAFAADLADKSAFKVEAYKPVKTYSKDSVST